jgi:transcriptional regulator with XRE-family HTH domain
VRKRDQEDETRRNTMLNDAMLHYPISRLRHLRLAAGQSESELAEISGVELHRLRWAESVEVYPLPPSNQRLSDRELHWLARELGYQTDDLATLQQLVNVDGTTFRREEPQRPETRDAMYFTQAARTYAVEALQTETAHRQAETDAIGALALEVAATTLESPLIRHLADALEQGLDSDAFQAAASTAARATTAGPGGRVVAAAFLNAVALGCAADRHE